MIMGRALLATLPPCATTGIGSLPFTDPAEAVAHVWAGYDLPFSPQLPRLEGDLVAEWLGDAASRCGWSPERDRVRPYAWPELLNAVAAVPPRPTLVKIQVTGPCTLAWALLQDGAYADPGRLAREIGVWLAANARELVSDLAVVGAGALLVVDEPALQHADELGISPLRAWQPLRGIAAAWGLHLCGPPPWPLLSRSALDVLFLDIVRYPLDPYAATVVGQAIRHGTRIGFGALPSDGSLDEAAAFADIRRAVTTLTTSGLEPAPLARAALITPTCGAATIAPAAARHLADAARDLAGEARALMSGSGVGRPVGARHSPA